MDVDKLCRKQEFLLDNNDRLDRDRNGIRLRVDPLLVYGHWKIQDRKNLLHNSQLVLAVH
jgi:hypothetical protein